MVRHHAGLILRGVVAAGLATLVAACSTVAPTGPVAPVDAVSPPADPAAASETDAPAPSSADPLATPPPVPAEAAPGERAATEALAQIGTPYRFGGAGPRGFDCSGLVQHAYRHAGIALPRETREQRRATRALAAPHESLALGDLLFFRRDSKGALHVALYIGDRRFVHAPSSGKSVRIERLDDPHWKRRFLEARRPS